MMIFFFLSSAELNLLLGHLEVRYIFINNTHTHTQREGDPHYLLGVVPVFIPPASERRFVKSLLEEKIKKNAQHHRGQS